MELDVTSPPPAIPNISSDSVPVGDPTISWLNEHAREAEAFLASQPGWDQISAAISAIMSADTDPLDTRSPLSQIKTNRIAKIAEDLAALMTDTKPFWDYSVFNRRFEQHAQLYGKLATMWYQQRNIDLRMADVIKYTVVAGTGYLHVYWDPEIGDVNARAEDPRAVLPIDPTGYESLESCRGVIIKTKVPVSYLRDRYGEEIESDSDGSALNFMSRMRDVVTTVISPIWKFHKSSPKTQPDLPKIPTVWLYTCYLKDHRCNTKEDLGDQFVEGASIEMGVWHEVTNGDGSKKRVPSNNWSYLVRPGERLFPNRRMILWAREKRLYDGPSFYWHDRFPLIKLTPNPWPWSWLGKAPVWDLLRLQTSLNRLLRIVEDHASQVAQPGSVHDKNSVSKSTFDGFDTRRPGWKIFQNPLAGKGIQVVNPPPLDASIPETIKWIIEEMETLSGKIDITKMMNLNQLPSNSTVESILNSMTPALRFRSRILEAFARELAMQLAYNFTQYYTLPMRVAILGPAGQTQDDFDYDPGTLMPDFTSDRDYTSDGAISPEAFLRGPAPRYNRAKEFLRRFIFKIAPGSLLNAAQVEQKLIYLQLTRAGWMDIFTLWEVLGIPNIGVLPDNVRTIPERLQYQASIGLTGNVNPAGRKASAQEPPRIVQKES